MRARARARVCVRERVRCVRARARRRPPAAQGRANQLMAALPGGGGAEDGSELRRHACGVAKVETRGRVPGVGRIIRSFRSDALSWWSCGCQTGSFARAGVMSNSKHASRALTHNSIVLFLDDVQLEFTSIFDTAPNLDLNAIPAGYRIIGMSARVDAAHASAPLKSQNEVKTVHERRVQRLSVFYERASELSHIHAKLAADMMLTNKVLQLLTLGATTSISFLVKAWVGNEDLLMVSGIVVTIVGGINSWTKYADYLAKVRLSPILPLLAT